MPPRFAQLSLQDFDELLRRFPFSRRIDAVHLHHTWRPNHAQYRGHDSIVGMWRHHTQTKGWRDIAQHITIGPDGSIWLGRNWNLPPASAAGHNGNTTVGPFMIEMVGDFDHGRDRLEGLQRENALKIVALIQRHFQLAPEAIRFHNQMSGKTCPGSVVDRDQVLTELRALHGEDPERLGIARARGADGPFGEEALQINEVLERFTRNLPPGEDPPNAEPDHEAMSGTDLRRFYDGEAARGGQRGGGPSARLTPEMLTELRPHLVNLTQGRFSSEGRFTTTRGDVDAIFDEHLLREVEGARARGERLRVVFYAHGGLVSESSALGIAHNHVDWWRKNRVYPIYFIWETGLFETIGQILTRAGQRVARARARDVFDFTTDPILEAAARTVGGPVIWSGMKRSAERSVDRQDGNDPETVGGARYTAERLKAFCDQHRDAVELHAVGHSAGSIFLAHFIPTALDLGVPRFASVHLMAPAIRVDTFHRRLGGRLGDSGGIDHLALFTMRKERELDDHCARVYRKSLLYLIHHALEPERKAPILGLEVSLRDDPELRRLFGLGGRPAADNSVAGEVVWSISPSATGRSASTATSHGGFDEDTPTMNSIVRRVLGKDDNDSIVGFPPTLAERVPDLWREQVDWPEELELPPGVTGAADGGYWAPSPFPSLSPVTALGAPARAQGNGAAGTGMAGGGRRRALCVGIDQYPTAPLAGCVADARLWTTTLRRLGFDEPVILLDSTATRAAILDELSTLVTTSTPGDVVVFQFAGHGTQLPDVGGDEANGDSADRDEALCPFDFASGSFVIDDDVAEVFARIPDSVNVTCFVDCCHSGTISRFGVGAAFPTDGSGLRARFLAPTPEMIEAHRRFRRQRGVRHRGATTARGPESMREVLFSACRSTEVAWESGGQGEFTLRATRVLAGGGLEGLTNEAFQERVVAEFGPMPRQHPELDCAPTVRSRRLLAPLLAGAGNGNGALPVGGGTASLGGQSMTPAQLLRLLAAALEGRA